MLLRYYQDKIKEETSVLFKMEKKKKGVGNKKQCNVDAKEHYLEEINHFLITNFTPSAMSVMGYRRRPHAWAIADAIKEFRDGKNISNDDDT